MKTGDVVKHKGNGLFYIVEDASYRYHVMVKHFDGSIKHKGLFYLSKKDLDVIDVHKLNVSTRVVKHLIEYGSAKDCLNKKYNNLNGTIIAKFYSTKAKSNIFCQVKISRIIEKFGDSFKRYEAPAMKLEVVGKPFYCDRGLSTDRSKEELDFLIALTKQKETKTFFK